MASITFNVPAISCQHCVNTINMELGEVLGIEKVISNTDTKTVQVEYQDPVTEAQIELLAEINYPVEK